MSEPIPLHPTGRHYGTAGSQWQTDQIARAEGRPPHAAPSYVPRKTSASDQVLFRVMMWLCIAGGAVALIANGALLALVLEMRGM